MKVNVAWIEIPVSNIERAAKFYGTLFDTRFEIIPGNTGSISVMALPPDVPVGVSLNKTTNFEPGAKGPAVGFAAGNEIEALLGRVEPAGGRIITRRGELTLPGNYFASVEDSEGNIFSFVWAE